MEFISTRNHKQKVGISAAIQAGLAADGGLYIPTEFPNLRSLSLNQQTYPQVAYQVLQPFFQGSELATSLVEMCRQAFCFDVPVVGISKNTHILELFHGPTLSFKDFGARFLAECITRLSINQKTTIMVATSGDTGSAVASAFFNKPNVFVVVLFPKGKISLRQQKQITGFGHNVIALEVEGNFDDCQRLVKSAFEDIQLDNNHLTTANSINIGRLLPQTVYYCYVSLQLQQQLQQPIGIIVPSGNLGNVTAAYWAKKMGAPIREIAIATNANQVIPDFLQTGEYQPRISKATLANAMDVGKPSNFERLSALFPTFSDCQREMQAFSVDDQKIKQEIQQFYAEHHYMMCPHTATASYFRRQLSADQPWLIVATAHPSKFETIVEPLLKKDIPIPTQLQKMLDSDSHQQTISNKIKELREVLSAL